MDLYLTTFSEGLCIPGSCRGLRRGRGGGLGELPNKGSSRPVNHLIRGQKISTSKAARAKELRREMTPAERKLWQHLRNNLLEGFHFRRQQIIEPYVVDFYCHQAALVVEVDGSVHQDQQEYDTRRERGLQCDSLYEY